MKLADPIDPTLSLRGLTVAPSQRLGALRVVPLLRAHDVPSLTLESVAPGGPSAPAAHDRTTWLLPHGLLARWTAEGPLASFGAHLSAEPSTDAHSILDLGWSRAEDGLAVRWTPLPVWQEGLLLSVLGATGKHWSRYAASLPTHLRRQFKVHPNAGEALRTFEPHDGQSGALVFAGDTLLLALILPGERAWARVHRAFVTDLLTDPLRAYAATDAPGFQATLDGAAVRTLDDLRRALEQSRSTWATASVLDTGSLLTEPAVVRRSLTRNGFTAARLCSDLRARTHAFFAEAVFTRDRSLAALTLVGLSRTQARRAFLMQQVLAGGHRLRAIAGLLGSPVAEAERRVRNNGLGYLIEGP